MRLAELCSDSRLSSLEGARDPATVEPLLAAVRLLVEDPPGALAVGACPGKPRTERVLAVLESFIRYLRQRSDSLRAEGGSGFYTLGSLLAEPGGWNLLEMQLPGLVVPAVLEAVPPQRLLAFLGSDPLPGQTRLRSASVLSLLGATLTAQPGEASPVLSYVAALARLQAAPQLAGSEPRRRLAQQLVDQLLLDPPLLLERPGLGESVAASLGDFVAALPDAELREEMLLAFNQSPVGADFQLSEAVEASAHVLARPSLSVVPVAGSFHPEPDPFGRILASVYSLPSHFFGPEDTRPFLQALLREAPADRKILVLADFRMRRALQLGDRITFLETYGRYYSPWPRDPFLYADATGGQTALLFRPPLETKRQDDSFLAQEIWRKLPEPLRQELGLSGLAPSPLRFHVGHLLFGKRQLFLSVHALEEETLARQRRGDLPAADRADPAGVLRYLDNVQAVARELGLAWAREPVFIHPFPPVAGVEQLRSGAGRDLDSYMALVEDAGGLEVPVVGSLALGRELASALDGQDAAALTQSLRLGDVSLEDLRAGLLAYNQEPAARAFESYLDLVAGHLKQITGRCERLPLLVFPVRLLADRERIDHADFLIGWTNLVAERRASGSGTARCVELFSQGIPSGDRQARKLYEGLGLSCRFFPWLRNSVVFGGGYRCASNHLRVKLEAPTRHQHSEASDASGRERQMRTPPP